MGSRLSRLNRNTPEPEQPPQDSAQSSTTASLSSASQPPKTSDGDATPGKQYTSPRVAALRKQLRPKLVSTPDEMDQMDSTNPEHQQIVRDRLKIVLGVGTHNSP